MSLEHLSQAKLCHRNTCHMQSYVTGTLVRHTCYMKGYVTGTLATETLIT